MKTLVFAALLLVFGAVSGCTGIAGAIAGGDLTDAVIKRAEGFNDRALEDLQKAEDFLRQKTARLARAKCRFPYTALVRYGCTSAAHRQAVEDDCGLVVKCNSGASVRPPPAGPPE